MIRCLEKRKGNPGKELKDTEFQFLLTEGKSHGLNLTSDNLINQVIMDEKLEHPRGREKLDGIVVKNVDTQKETKEQKAPELDDDEGMTRG